MTYDDLIGLTKQELIDRAEALFLSTDGTKNILANRILEALEKLPQPVSSEALKKIPNETTLAAMAESDDIQEAHRKKEESISMTIALSVEQEFKYRYKPKNSPCLVGGSIFIPSDGVLRHDIDENLEGYLGYLLIREDL